MAAVILPVLQSLFRGKEEAFNLDDFEEETSRHSSAFDPQDIAAVTAKAEAKAKELVTDVRSYPIFVKSSQKVELRRLISYIDLTTLAGDDTKSRVEALVDRALTPLPNDHSVRCAAVCVYPARVADVKAHLKNRKAQLSVASVAAGFPSGQYRIESKILEVQLAVADGASEIDIVISRAAALDDDWKLVYDEVAELKGACGNAHLKTILATGELKTLTNVYKASWASILAGSDFIKTSTGKETVNATLEVASLSPFFHVQVAYVMALAIRRWYELTGRRVGFKPAGGIKTAEEAFAYAALIEDVLGKEWLTPNLFRIGASSLLDNIIKLL